MSEALDFTDVTSAQSTEEAAARWWGGVLLFGADGNRQSRDLSDRMGSNIYRATFRMPDEDVVKSIVSHLTIGAREAYNAAPEYGGITRLDITTDGNRAPSKTLGHAMLQAGVENAREVITGMLPADGAVRIENDIVYAKLGRMQPFEQIWPPVPSMAIEPTT